MRAKISAILVPAMFLLPAKVTSQVLCTSPPNPVCNTFGISTTTSPEWQTLLVTVMAYPGLTVQSVLIGDHSGRVPFGGSNRYLFEPFQTGVFSLQATFPNPIPGLDAQIAEVQSQIAFYESEIATLQPEIEDLLADIQAWREFELELMDVIFDGTFPVVVEFPDERVLTLLNEAEARDCLDDAEQVRISLQTQQAEKEGVLRDRNEMLQEKLDELENLQTLQYDNLLNAENLEVLSWSGDWNEESLECVLGEPGCSIQTDIVPEPATVVLLATGLFGIGLSAWRRRDQEAD